MNTSETNGMNQLRTKADVAKSHIKSEISDSVDKTSQTISELKNNIKNDLKEFMSAAATSGKAELSVAADRLNAYVEKMYESAIELSERGKASAQSAMKKTDEYVKKNPWRSTAIAAGAGTVLGIVLRSLIKRS
jgi:ElaB/YqjD/DUF883 family membrane-anchored ribosome-binding protein